MTLFINENGTSRLEHLDSEHLIVSNRMRQVGSVAGVPSQKPKEQQRSVLRPAVLQAPPSKSHIESSECSLESPALIS